jgi:hypothetical protein
MGSGQVGFIAQQIDQEGSRFNVEAMNSTVDTQRNFHDQSPGISGRGAG